MKHRVLILGIDGYIGWPLALHLLRSEKYEVAGLDNYSRRLRVDDIESNSLTPIATALDRRCMLREFPNFIRDFGDFTLDEYEKLDTFLQCIKPHTIIHLAEMPSAPWSMKNNHFAALTQQENIIGTLHLLWSMRRHCPEAHLIKLGTMGEYGTPNCDIPEGRIPKECMVDPEEWPAQQDCPMHGLMFPRSPGSFYHLSKVHDSLNIKFACETWGLSSTDIMQGVVFGLNYDDFSELGEQAWTRFDYDEYFGTVINRFCAQYIVGMEPTIYGIGGQTRGFLTLSDSIQCLNIVIDKSAYPGEYRTLNQFENIYKIEDLAYIVCSYDPTKHMVPQHIENPRTELEMHYYNPSHQTLFNLGYVPNTDVEGEIHRLISSIEPYADRVNQKVIMPKTTWC